MNNSYTNLVKKKKKRERERIFNAGISPEADKNENNLKTFLRWEYFAYWQKEIVGHAGFIDELAPENDHGLSWSRSQLIYGLQWPRYEFLFRRKQTNKKSQVSASQ